MIKLCYDVNDYRRQIGQVINDEDTVIELGCHTGNTSRVILENNVKLIAIDNSPEASQEMDKLDLTFINADVRLHDTLSEVFKSYRKAMKSFDLSFKNDVAYSILLKPLFQKKYHFLGMGVHKSNSLI